MINIGKIEEKFDVGELTIISVRCDSLSSIRIAEGCEIQVGGKKIEVRGFKQWPEKEILDIAISGSINNVNLGDNVDLLD